MRLTRFWRASTLTGQNRELTAAADHPWCSASASHGQSAPTKFGTPFALIVGDMVRSPSPAKRFDRILASKPGEFEQVLVAADLAPLPESAARLDWGLAAGFVISAIAVLMAAGAAGVGLSLFVQPAALLMVLGGTLGATLVTTPTAALRSALGRFITLARLVRFDRAAFVEQITDHARSGRSKGLVQLEAVAESIHEPLLREGLLLAADGLGRDDIASALELRLRLMERQGEADARVFENAGGFAPTIGVMGTVLGLLTVMRQFSDLTAVAGGIGTAFVSTLYGLGLANLVLLPLANRIRASVAESYELGEMAMEGALCVRDGMPTRLVHERLSHYVR
jgi:chemotaxis protein MotA